MLNYFLRLSSMVIWQPVQVADGLACIEQAFSSDETGGWFYSHFQGGLRDDILLKFCSCDRVPLLSYG